METNGNKQLCRWAFTTWTNTDVEEEINEQKTYLIKTFKTLCNRYCFQLEKSTEEGRLHWQGRISFKNGKRKTEALKIFGDYIKATTLRIEHDEEKSEFYCLKEETRVSGPYTNKDVDRKVPWDLEDITELRPWQFQAKALMDKRDKRHIDVLYCEHGNTGKSTFTKWLEWNEMAVRLPFCNDFKDIMRMAYDVGEQKVYLIDIPRAITKERLFQMWGAIEELKSGFCYDDRYEFKKRIFGNPNIWVFTNTMPDKSMLSNDRFRVWRIHPETLTLESV